MSKQSDFEPGTFGCHEALHMAAFFADAVDRELCGHNAIKANRAWSKLAREAQDALADLYQAIGKVHIA